MKTAADASDEREDLLQYHLHSEMATKEPGRAFKNIHASAVTKEGYCPREAALSIKLNVEPPVQFVATVDDLVWAQGRLLAQHVIDTLIARGIVLADWRCTHCDALHEFLDHKPEGCNVCHRVGVLEYSEVRFRSMASGIGGGIDLLVKLPGRAKLLIVELKTMDKEKFKALSAPLSEHRERTQLYLRCAAESNHGFADLVDQTEARILYVSKGGWGSKFKVPPSWGLHDRGWTPFKEFRVKRHDEAVQPYVDLATPLFEFLHCGTIPAGICPSLFAKRADSCKVKEACFSGQFPAGSID